jgi:uncharacterized surface protein with fasciclin (FAS1) repeats
VAQNQTVAGLLTELSGSGEFDDNPDDFDLLLALVDAAGLTGALDGGLQDITVLAPNDRAFYKAAMEFGYDGDYNEEAIFGYLAAVVDSLSPEGTLAQKLQFPLTYHLIDQPLRWRQLANTAGEEITTMCDCTITIRRRNRKTLVVKDVMAPYPKIIYPQSNYRTQNGYVHVLDRMMVPIDGK